MEMDLASLQSVRDFTEQYKGPLVGLSGTKAGAWQASVAFLSFWL